MVFSSIPSYLDPSNWQQANPQPTTTTSSQLVVLPALPAAHGGGGGVGSAAMRPTPMAERARMANIPMPESAQKCPRCDSSNTKFCYYNNYNLTQPRHFCKTCRRYWTRGGALRNVPIGGGCRRNKRNKSSGSSSNSKSTASTSTSAGTTATTTSCGPTTLLGLSPQIPPLRFMAPMSQLGDHFIPGDLGLHYGGGISGPLLQPNHDVMHNFPNMSLGGGSTFFQAGGVESTHPWRFQPCQISSMAGLEGHGSGSMLFPFQGMENNNSGYSNDIVRPKMGVKMEDNNNNLQEMNLSRQFINQGNDNHHHQYYNWGNGGGNINGTGPNNSWPDLSGFSSSSTTSNAL